MPGIIRTLTCKHKIWGKFVTFETPIKCLPCFQCPRNLEETYRDCQVLFYFFFFKNNTIKRFLNNREICRCGPNYIQKW